MFSFLMFVYRYLEIRCFSLEKRVQCHRESNIPGSTQNYIVKNIRVLSNKYEGTGANTGKYARIFPTCTDVGSWLISGSIRVSPEKPPTIHEVRCWIPNSHACGAEFRTVTLMLPGTTFIELRNKSLNRTPPWQFSQKQWFTHICFVPKASNEA